MRVGWISLRFKKARTSSTNDNVHQDMVDYVRLYANVFQTLR